MFNDCFIKPDIMILLWHLTHKIGYANLLINLICFPQVIGGGGGGGGGGDLYESWIRFKFICFCFTLCSTARVILRGLVYRRRSQCIQVGQDFALVTTWHRQETINFPT